MKTKTRVPGKQTVPKEVSFPDPPLTQQDVPLQAVISNSEFLDMMNAYHTYNIARADFEKKRADVTLKLLLCARLESESYEVEFNQHGGLIVTETTSVPRSRFVIGEGDSHPEEIR